ncbi:MAG: hypothetical protein AVDCRST_MAG32-2214 [uncultured Nocardioides sp.]|uniref:Uncharacterized protein n=1 Tax=uncultured Nocardioides sp. TaxID=198441 RepID=A0A6J4NIU2_9ACTN|nr:MAG: hypothetical protein AVDCRST_MAG32-2214 [uncultured Nocardioides sp.]
MTGLLNDVMHERADSLDAPRLDLDAIIRDGDQRRSRRFRTVAGGLVAASLVVAGGVALPGLLPGGDRDRDVAASVHSYDVAYALGRTIHDGPRTVETDVRIAAFVQGVSGYVVADEWARVHTVVDGETTEVGRLADAGRGGRIVSDDDVVAWVDEADGGTLSVLDLATGERVDVPVDEWPGDPVSMEPGRIGGGSAYIAAVDGATVYVADARGAMAWDALDGDEPVLLPGPDGAEVEVRDVQDGQILHVVRTFEPEERNGRTLMVQVPEQRIGRDLEDGRSVPGVRGVLSPDGRSLAYYVERRRVDLVFEYTTSVGDADGDEWTTVTSDEHDNITVAQWLDADTFTAIGSTLPDERFRSGSSADEPSAGVAYLLTCETSTGTCASVRPYERGMVLPTGMGYFR